jgi:hypothetical protein
MRQHAAIAMVVVEQTVFGHMIFRRDFISPKKEGGTSLLQQSRS